MVYSAWSSPFELAFKKAASGGLLPVDLLVDAFFAIDILLTFFVAYLDKTTYLLIHHHNKIAFRYSHIICVILNMRYGESRVYANLIFISQR